MNRTLITIRWIARALSVLILLFWGCFIVAHLFGTEAKSSRPLVASDVIQLSMVLLWLAGLAMAWRWELAGAIVALAAAMIGAIVNPRAVMLALVPGIPAVLFLVSGWMARASRREICGGTTRVR